MLHLLSRFGRRLAGPLLLAGAGLAFATDALAARTLETAYGPVTLETAPERVVVLTETALDTALALDVEPVGSPMTRGGNGVAEYLKEKAGKVSMVGTTREVNLEAVLALQPDLILAAPGLPRELFDKLSLMAPVLVPATGSFDDWHQVTRFYAKALDREAAGDALLASLDARVAQLKERIEPGQTVSVVRWNPQGPIMMSSHIFVGQLLGQLGFESPALADSLTVKPHSDTLSLENLSQADGDWLLLATLNPDGEKALEVARQQPAFMRLGAVQKKQVASVDGQIWSSGSGPIAAQRVLDDVERLLAH